MSMVSVIPKIKKKMLYYATQLWKITFERQKTTAQHNATAYKISI